MSSLCSSTTKLSATINHLKDNEKRKFIAVRKSLGAVYNVMLGMYDGLSDDMSLSEFRQANTIITSKFLPMIQQGLISEMDVDADDSSLTTAVSSESIKSLKIIVSKSNEFKNALSAVAQSSTSVGATVTGNVKTSELEAMSLLTKAALPTLMRGNFQIVRVPIVPILPVIPAKVFEKAEELRRIGMKVLPVEGFLILQDQILLLVSQKRAKKSEVTPLSLVHSVVELINERGAAKYEIVSDTPASNVHNPDLLMYWILPRQRMAGFMKILGTKAAGLKWGLPLPATTADADKELRKQRIAEEEALEQRRQEALTQLALEREAKVVAKKEARENRIAKQKAEDDAKKDRIKKQTDARNNVMQQKLQKLVRLNKKRA